jgi:hypothetical protein
VTRWVEKSTGRGFSSTFTFSGPEVFMTPGYFEDVAYPRVRALSTTHSRNLLNNARTAFSFEKLHSSFHERYLAGDDVFGGGIASNDQPWIFDEGTGPSHKPPNAQYFPNLGNIARWLETVPNPAFGHTTKITAYQVAMSVYAKGTKGKHILKRALAVEANAFANNVDRMFRSMF